MTMIRHHKMFEVLIRENTRDRIEDDMGELQGYGEPYPVENVVKIVAPSESIAQAWVMDRGGPSAKREIIRCTAHDLDGCIIHFSY